MAVLLTLVLVIGFALAVAVPVAQGLGQAAALARRPLSWATRRALGIMALVSFALTLLPVWMVFRELGDDTRVLSALALTVFVMLPVLLVVLPFTGAKTSSAYLSIAGPR